MWEERRADVVNTPITVPENVPRSYEKSSRDNTSMLCQLNQAGAALLLDKASKCSDKKSINDKLHAYITEMDVKTGEIREVLVLL